MNDSQMQELLLQAKAIRELLEVLAEPAVAQRDAKLRTELRELVGKRVKMQQAVLLMDGTKTQSQLAERTGAHGGDLSVLVGKLEQAKLLSGDKKLPKLSIQLPKSFFESPTT